MMAEAPSQYINGTRQSYPRKPVRVIADHFMPFILADTHDDFVANDFVACDSIQEMQWRQIRAGSP